MQNNILSKIDKYTKKHKQYKIWQKIVGSLACMVVFVTTYMLILPAITMEKSAFCGMEEHQHGTKCYEQRLICGYGEEPETAHVHNDSCYESEQVLICGQEESSGHVHDDNCVEKEQVLICTDTSEEHVHTDACYEEKTTYICGKEEGEGAHTHGPECYETRKVLICDRPENTSVHTHTDACYEKVMVCGKEEHTHGLVCFSDPEADVESREDWERSVSDVELTGIWADDVIAIAQSQIGYTESTENYQVQEDGKTMKGYTRYGAWYGNEYGDWCAMFVSFCLNYADIPESAVPYEASCSRWIESLSDSYHKASGYTPVKGDIIFFDNNGDGTADHVGLVEKVNENNGTLKTIEGNSSDKVKENSYSLSDDEILGYGMLPENPEMVEDENGEETEARKSSAKAANYAARTSDTEESSDATDTGDDSVTENENDSSEQQLNVTDTSGTATYDKNNDTYTVDMTIDFTIDNTDPDTVVQNTYVYTYPEGYPLPAALTEGSHTLHDKGGNNAGTYTFRDNGDGTFTVVIHISEEYAKASTTGNTITGYISYRGTMDGSAENEDGELVIGSDTDQIIIPSKDITYPDGETHNYNVQTEKNGEYKIENGQLIYTVKVYSTKGTPGVINFEDTITADGLTLGTPSVTVQEMSRKDHQTGWIEEWVVNDTPISSVNPVFSDDNKTISLTLPKLDKPTVDESNVKEDKGYLITYIYDLTDAEAVSVTANNKVQVSSSNGNNGPTVKDETSTNVGVDRTLTFEKSGNYDRATGTVKWTIKVNNNKTNIAGATITDEMFSQAVDGTFKVEPDSGYTYNNNTITFNPTDGSALNNQTYTITYSTQVVSTWDEQNITNNAIFDPTPGESNSGDETEKNTTVPVGGGSVEKTKVSESIAEDKQSAEVEWKVTINVPDSGLPAGTEITDTASADIWMTREQVNAWSCVLYWQDANGDIASTTTPYNVPGTNVTFKGSDGNSYTFEQISQNQNGNLEKLTYQLNTIKLDEELTLPSGATKLVFTYKTTVDLSNANDGWNTYTNTVKVRDKEASAEFNYEVKTPTLSKTHGSVTYTKEDNQIQYVNIPWTVTIEVPDTGWVIGKKLTDDLTRTEWNEGAVHAITYQEALKMVTGAKWENGTDVNLADTDSFEVKFFTKDGTGYTYQELCNITDEVIKNSLEFTSFTITPLKIVNRPENETKIILSVTSRANVSTVEAGGERYYRNWVHVGNNKASDQYQYVNRQNSVVKYDGNWKTGNTTVTSSDGKVYWIVEVQLDNQVHTSVSITDTLPAGVTLESLKVAIDSKGECYPTILEDGKIAGETNGYTVSGSYNQFTQAIELTVKKADGSTIDTNKIQFYINCLGDENLKDKTAHTLKNDVTAKIDNVDIGSSSQTQDWTYQEQTVTHDKVTKTGKWDNNARLLEYQVVINPDGLDLVQDSDTLLTLIDELTYNHRNSGYQVANSNGGTDWVSSEYHFQVNLLQNRVKLYYAKLDSDGNLMRDDEGVYLKDGEVTGWSWTFSDSQIDDWRTTNTLTITGIPDGTPLIMEYAYQVSSDLPEKAYIQNLPISNTAKLMGKDQIGSGSHSGGEWKEQTTTGAVDSDKKVLKLVKVETEHFENVLSGAEFAVYEATDTSDDGELVWSEDAIRTYTTDDAGSFSIQYEEKSTDGQSIEFTYNYNTLYKVVETKAPDGYLISDTAKEYYFYFSSDEDGTSTLPANLPSGSMDLSISAFTVYAENMKESTDADTTEITVQKQWLDSTGMEANDRHDGDTVTLNLYRKTAQGGNSGGGESSGAEGISYTAKCNDNQEKSGIFSGIEIGDTVKISVSYTWQASLYNVAPHDWEGVSVGTGEYTNNGYTYDYTCKIMSDTIAFTTGDRRDVIADISCEIIEKGTTTESEPDTTVETNKDGWVKTETIDASNGWNYTFTDLPKTGTDEDGNTVTYYYYVVEEPKSNYTTSYSNNDGITEGTITVTNKANDTSGFELPETGGPGTKLYTLGGLLLALSAGIFLLYNYTRRRKEDRSSS